MLLKLLALICMFLIITQCANAAGLFSNQVEFPIKKDVYKFELEITSGQTMSIWNDFRNTYDPVLKNTNGNFYKRDDRYNTSCGSNSIVNNQTEKDTIITASGKHRKMLLINRKFPGEPIVVPLNAQVEVRVKNSLMSESLSLHWHGMTQKGTFYMDGVSRITQCAIAPGETFVYKFKANELGTHWYHSHSGVQRTEGLYGPLIVTDQYRDGTSVLPNDTPQMATPVYAKEFYFIVQDFYQLDSETMLNYVLWEDVKFMYGHDNTATCYTPNRMDDGTLTPPLLLNRDTDAILINGKGSYKIRQTSPSISNVDFYFSNIAFNMDLEEFKVTANSKYLFRVIGANSGHPLEIRIGDHKLYVVASDGNPIVEQEADSLIINGGERYDFYIKTKDLKNDKNFFITVRTLETKTWGKQPLSYQNYGLALLRYVATTKATCGNACKPCTKTTACTKVNCPYWPTDKDGSYNCIPINRLRSTNISSQDNELLLLSYNQSRFAEHFLNFHFSGSIGQRSSINGRRFVMPAVPLFQKRNPESVIKTCNKAQKTSDCTHILEIEEGKVIQFVLFNLVSSPGEMLEGTSHPVHLHGHHFYVLHVGYPQYSTTTGMIVGQTKDIICVDQQCTEGKWANPAWSNGNVPLNSLPIRKDTIFIPVGGYAIIRFKADNPGLWFLHCHIEVHQGEGMALLIREGSYNKIKNLINKNDVNLCEKGFEPEPNQLLTTTRSNCINSSEKLTFRLSTLILSLALIYLN